MKPFYAARVEDLSALDYLIVECKCGHVGSLTAKDLIAAGLQPYRYIKDRRCRECDSLVRGTADIHWHNAPVPPPRR
jgi:hypothetical protein